MSVLSDRFSENLPHLSADALHIADRLTALKPYQPGKPIEEVKRELGITGEIIKLASNENPLGPSPAAIKALSENLERLSQYPDGGCHELRMAVAEAIRVSPDQLIFGNGSDEIIHLLGLTFLEEGDEVIVGDPTFVLYEAAATLAGAKTVKVPLTRPDLVHDLGAMSRAITDKTRLVFIANPHNPTGTVVDDRDAIDALIARLPSRAILVLDEAYGEFVYDLPNFPAALSYIRAGAPVIGLRTFSKMYGLAGQRVGFGVAAPEVIKLLNQARSPFNVNLAAQISAAAAINDTEFIQKTRQANDLGRQQFYTAFERLRLPYIPSFANFVLVDTKRPCREVFNALLQKGVITRTGDVFDLPTFLRVTVGTPSQNERFIAALQDVLPTIPESAGS